MKSLTIIVCLIIVPFANANPLEVTLTLKQNSSIDQLAENVSDPNSDRYGNFYTPEEIKDLVGPSDQDYQTLLANLQREGFHVVDESRTHLLLRVEADHTVFERVFRTKLTYSHRYHYLKSGAFSVPERLSLIANVTGFDNRHSKIPHYQIHKVETLDNAQPGILPAQIKEAYKLTSLYQEGLSGKDEDIAIAAFMDFSLDNVRTYYEKIGLSPMPKIEQITFDGHPAPDDRAAVETELDSELSGMIAPGANIHVFSSSQNSDAGELNVFNAILDDNRSKLVNYSWGECEAVVSPQHRKDMEALFARAVAQGVNILVASGDAGSDGCENRTLSAGWPNINPWVISVGGTTLNLGTKTKHLREIAWQQSGGGVSKNYPQPVWQKLHSTYLKRADPDIAFNSDPMTGEAVWSQEARTDRPGWVIVGGTSMAAPQWVGFLALVNEARRLRNKETLGYLNPLLYKIPLLEKSRVFRDIIRGSNGAYRAQLGWDAVTGWGSMKGDALLRYLLSQ